MLVATRDRLAADAAGYEQVVADFERLGPQVIAATDADDYRARAKEAA